jgi:protein-disulfide isomerase
MPTPLRSPSALGLRHLLEVGTNLAVMAAALSVLWLVISGNRQPTSPPVGMRPSARPPQPAKPIPAQPVSIATAAVKGSPTASVVIIEFSDFQCPWCGAFARNILPELEKRFVGTGQVQIAFMHLPIASIHPLAMKAAEAAECAGRQGKFWEMYKHLFRDQDRLSIEILAQHGSALGLDSAAFQRCLAGEMTPKIQRDLTLARELGIAGTPAFLIGVRRADGAVEVTGRLDGARNVEAFEEHVQRALTRVQ